MTAIDLAGRVTVIALAVFVIVAILAPFLSSTLGNVLGAFTAIPR